MFHFCVDAMVRMHAAPNKHASIRQREFRRHQEKRFRIVLLEGIGRASMPWSYQVHVHFVCYLGKCGIETNKLFATLLLGLQRLEDTSALPQAHQRYPRHISAAPGTSALPQAHQRCPRHIAACWRTCSRAGPG